MNIIYMHTHDSGRYLQPYGYGIPTPGIMALAQQGTVFRNAYCAAPTCSPSRAALLSGMTAHSAGMLGLAHRGFQMNDYTKHLAHYLKDGGYHTVLCGMQHEAPRAAMIGYDEILRCPPDNGADSPEDLRMAQQAANFIRGVSADKPFFLSFGMFSTHRVYPDYTHHVNPDYVQVPFPVADTPENRADMAGYMRSAQIADACVSLVTDALRQSGRDKDTIVLFTTDHGIAFPHMKCSLYDTGIGVSLIIRFPNNPAAGKVSDALVSHLDVFPTLCGLTGMAKPDWLQGYSLEPIFQDVSQEIRSAVFAEINYHAAYEPARCMRTKRYKLIRYYDYHNRYVSANTDDSSCKRLLMENGWLDGVRPREMLFDLYLDPVERINLADAAAYRSIQDEMSAQLYQWMQDTQDPLLLHQHRIPAPDGAQVNLLSALQPNELIFE